MRGCRGPNAAPASGQVEVPNSQRISCLDSSLGRASACGAGGRRFAPRPWHVCLGALLEDKDDPGQVSIVVTPTWFETRGLASISGLPHLQGLFGLHPNLSPGVTPHALGRPCRGPNAAPASGQVEVPNTQCISCLDSSLGRTSACGAGGGGSRPARDMFVSALS